MKTKTIPVTTPRYLDVFHCLGPSCPDTCCSDAWVLPVDRDAYQRLENASDPALRNLIRIRVEPQPSERATPRDFARIAHTGSGTCSFLGSDGWCTIQQQAGEAAQPRFVDRH